MTYGVKGDAVVGVAAVPEGDDWQAKAWGVGTATGCLHHSSAIEDGLHGIELMPQRLVGDFTERFVHLELDLDESTVRLRWDGPWTGSLPAIHRWTEVPVRLPSAVRPWALIPEDAEDDIDPTVRLVGCLAEPVPLHLVDGLCGVVAPLGVATQRRALRWCTEEGFFDVAAIEATGAAKDFVRALDCPSHLEAELLHRLGQPYRRAARGFLREQ